MISESEAHTAPAGERLLTSLFAMTRAVTIFHASNPRLFATIDVFRKAIEEIHAETGQVMFRVHSNRFYLNRQLLTFPPAVLGNSLKLADYFNVRNIQGFRFLQSERLWDEQVISFIELLNRAEREKDPVSWLQSKLRGEVYSWVELLVEQDFELIAQDGGLGPSAAGTDGGRRTSPLTASAREAYSQVLTATQSTTGKLPSQKRVSLQRTKRVIQNMIDILSADENILLGLGTIRDYDDYTYTHSVNVAILSMCLAKRLGLSRTLVEQVGLCGIFHDLGKVDIPTEIITKAGRLTDEEFDLIKKHPIYSIRQIMHFAVEHELKAKFVLSPFEHHLGINFTGYPQTGHREAISLLGRILAIADQYDALTSHRAYRAAPFSPDKALRIMVESSGTKLDPILLKVFIDMVGVFPVGSCLYLDTGEIGLVAEMPEKAEAGRPIMVLLEKAGDGYVAGERVDLSERAEDGEKFKRNIVRSVHPSEFGIQPSDFLL
ncbi:MAG: HD-GYP domain-containing protein [Planctomycetota bacterium]|jgi:HD-GYP domain-containing protein (c-di-GMP phosphodiesterase class II)|nr:HD-GYP domain-containing protein [Planctomycetota bacterium]